MKMFPNDHCLVFMCVLTSSLLKSNKALCLIILHHCDVTCVNIIEVFI